MYQQYIADFKHLVYRGYFKEEKNQTSEFWPMGGTTVHLGDFHPGIPLFRPRRRRVKIFNFTPHRSYRFFFRLLLQPTAQLERNRGYLSIYLKEIVLLPNVDAASISEKNIPKVCFDRTKFSDFLRNR